MMARMTKTIGTRRLGAVMVSPLALINYEASLQLPATGVKMCRCSLSYFHLVDGLGKTAFRTWRNNVESL